MEISQILKALRENAKMDLHDLVTKSEISRAWVYKIEKGEVPSPSVAIVRKWVLACKPEVGDQVALAEWMRLGMLIVFNNDDVSEINQADVTDESMTKKPDISPKQGWLARVIKSTLAIKGK